VRLVLVDNLLIPERGDLSSLDVHPHLGLISLAAVAEAAGHEVEVFDPKWHVTRGGLDYDGTLYRRAAERIAESRPDAVGFTTLGCSFIFTLNVARHLEHLLPGAPILLGGPHATILHREMLAEFEVFDVVVRHEAEDTLLLVLEALGGGRGFEGISGVSWRSGGAVKANPGAPAIEDLDRLPMPAYERYPIAELGLDNLRIDAGRGCPFHCTFCSTASFFGRNYRLKSPQRLVGELDALHERYGFTDFKLNHDLFTVNRKKVLAFCEAVAGRGYTWGVSARVDCVDEALLEAMWGAGCRGIYFGIETGSRRMQKVVQKRLDLDLVEPTLDVTERLGMRTIVSFITGYPEESPEDQDATLDLLGGCFRRDRELFTTQLHMLTPEPGTQYYETLGDRLLYDGYLTDFNAALLAAGDEATVTAHPEIFVTYHHYPTEMPREDHVFAVDAYRILRKAGHTILTYACKLYGGRFSVLVGRLRDHARRQGWGAVDVPRVLEFLAAEHGEAHHVVSLFRYALVTEAARKVAPTVPDPASPDARLESSRPYRLGAGVYLFRRLHDCSRLIEKISSSVNGHLLDEAEVGELGCYMVIGRGTRDGAMDNYALTTESHAVLSLFESPCSFEDVCRVLAPLTGGEAPEPEFFEDLIGQGILVPAAPAEPAVAPGAAAASR
jgi:radical SAM superfamily enzyme YgiQ (UPF0313 family)